MTSRPGRVAAAAGVAAVVAAFRFLALSGFPDDHYVHLAGAQQIWFGDWPSRDFVDLGAPLSYILSAAAQALLGRDALSEAVLLSAAFGAAAALTFSAGRRLTGSAWLALAAVAIEVLIFPRTYSYPKLLAHAAAAVAILHYVDAPARGRMILLAAVVVVAGLLRQDHGLVTGAAAAVAVVAAPLPGGGWRRLKSAALFALTAVALAAPYALYIERVDGIGPHLQRGIGFARTEMERRAIEPSLADEPAIAWLLAVVRYAAPAALVCLVAVTAAGADGARRDRSRVLPLAAMAWMASASLVRDPLDARLADAAVPAALLLAWMVRLAWRPWPRAAAMPLRVAAVVILAVTVGSTAALGRTHEQLDRVGVFAGVDALPSRFGERAGELRGPIVSGRQVPTATARVLLPFFAYVQRCVGEGDHILVPGFMPEVPVLARRRFAGGQIWHISGALADVGDRRLVVRRLLRQRVPVAVLRQPRFDDIVHDFPALGLYVAQRFTPMAVLPLGDGEAIHLLANHSLATGRDAATGWPCFA